MCHVFLSFFKTCYTNEFYLIYNLDIYQLPKFIGISLTCEFSCIFLPNEVNHLESARDNKSVFLLAVFPGTGHLLVSPISPRISQQNI